MFAVINEKEKKMCTALCVGDRLLLLHFLAYIVPLFCFVCIFSLYPFQMPVCVFLFVTSRHSCCIIMSTVVLLMHKINKNKAL